MDHQCNQGPRFDVIESGLENVRAEVKAVVSGQHEANRKLDGITNLLVEQAKTNERLDHLETSQYDHEERVRILEADTSKNSFISSGVERIGWVVLTTLAGILAYSIRG